MASSEQKKKFFGIAGVWVARRANLIQVGLPANHLDPMPPPSSLPPPPRLSRLDNAVSRQIRCEQWRQLVMQVGKEAMSAEAGTSMATTDIEEKKITGGRRR